MVDTHSGCLLSDDEQHSFYDFSLPEDPSSDNVSLYLS